MIIGYLGDWLKRHVKINVGQQVAEFVWETKCSIPNSHMPLKRHVLCYALVEKASMYHGLWLVLDQLETVPIAQRYSVPVPLLISMVHK